MDCALCWYERRQPLYELAIELAFSKEDKEAELVDENGRELPQWLKEAEEKDMDEKNLKYRTISKKALITNFAVNYGVKLALIAFYASSFPQIVGKQ